MKKTLLFTCCLSFICNALWSQHRPVIAAPGFRMKDTATLNLLLQSLNGFLEQKEQPNEQNSYVWQQELPATSVLLDEIKGIERNDSAKEDHFYQALLNNVTLLTDSSYLVQFYYCGMLNGQPSLKAAFRLQARRAGSQFCFYSPLKRNCTTWKTWRQGMVVFYYKDSIHTAKAKEYQRYNDAYLRKLGNDQCSTQYYCCSDMQEALQLLGVDYKQDYTGRRYGGLSSTQQNTTVMVSGAQASGSFLHFDPHDLWHEKLRTVLSPSLTNRAVDEGCAYLYGGSWGLSWREIKALFTVYRQQHPQADWLKLYTEGTNFKEGNNLLKVSYFLNALVVQQLEKEQGFTAVKRLLSCGKQEEGDENYFKALEGVAGISKEQFNNHINTLLQDL